MPAQQLLLQHSAPRTAQHLTYPHTLHQQVPTPTYIPTYTAPMYGYAGHYIAPPGDAMVDPEEHLGVTQSAYVVPAPAAPSPPAATPESNDDRFTVLEKALRQM